MKETIKRAFLGGLVFLGTILFGFIGYSAWISLSADVPQQNNGDTITKDTWNNIVDKLNKTIDNVNYINSNLGTSIPTGAVMSFNLDSCPAGWSVLASANGRVIVGIGSDGQGNTYTRGITGGEAKHTLTITEMPSHNHSLNSHDVYDTNAFYLNDHSGDGIVSSDNLYGNFEGRIYYTNGIGGGQSHENRQPYLALLYCVKN